MRFRQYLLTEETNYLAQKIGDILSATQSLAQDASNLGTRQLVKSSQRIVDQIRKILHDSWSDKEERTLKELQKVGVAISKAIDSNGDLEEILNTSVEVLQNATEELKSPINNLETT
jgi:HPt (histidine-containing phosphotransfer) domain-containing protein